MAYTISTVHERLLCSNNFNHVSDYSVQWANRTRNPEASALRWLVQMCFQLDWYLSPSAPSSSLAIRSYVCLYINATKPLLFNCVTRSRVCVCMYRVKPSPFLNSPSSHSHLPLSLISQPTVVHSCSLHLCSIGLLLCIIFYSYAIIGMEIFYNTVREGCCRR